ncbi:MAG: Methyl-accepting chemotaxis protein I [Candidatus Erwinia impunctatus]|nr:Methyl-accepting chemotaxis protein I [Culicoides impunctatus]
MLFRSIAAMRIGIRQIIADITAVADSIATGTEKMEHHNKHIMLQNQQQNANFLHLSQRLHRVSEEVESGAEFSQLATQQANSADQLMQDCAQEVDSMEHQMQLIVGASGDISGIVDILDNLSLQTRLLALNASIESSHAGQYGRSFSVVAKEIGLLSQRSGVSTREIDNLIQDTQHHIKHGFSKVQTLEGLFGKITEAVSTVVTQLKELEHNISAQSHRVSKIAREVTEMNEQLQQSEQHHLEQVDAAAHLRKLSDRLALRAQQFQLEMQH